MRRFLLCSCLGVLQLLATPLADEADDKYQEGMRLAEAGQLDDARRLFLAGRVAAPNDKRFPIELAGVAYKQGDRKGAALELREALRLDPDDAYANQVLGGLLLLDGNLEAALPYWNRIEGPRVSRVLISGVDSPYLRRAVEANPGDVLLSEDLARTSANLDRLGVQRRITLVPNNSDSYDLLLDVAPCKGIWAGWTGVGLTALSGLPYQTLQLNLSPRAGWVQHISSTFRWDPNKRLAAGYLSGVVNGDPHLIYTAGGEARDEIWDIRTRIFRMSRISGTVQLEQGLNSRLSWTNSLSVGAVRFEDTPAGVPAFAGGTEVSGRSRLSWDALRRHEQHLFVTGTAEAEFGRLMSLPQPYARFQSGASMRWRPITAAVRGGWSAGQLPFDRYFMLGMERDNDLWVRGHVGTKDGRKGNSPLGKQYVVTQLDAMKTILRRPFLRWELGPVLDTGTAPGPFGSHGWMVDAGLETRLHILDSMTLSVIAGRDLRNGGTVIYTAVRSAPNPTHR